MLDQSYAEYAWEQTCKLLAIDSPSGFTQNLTPKLKEIFENLGFPTAYNNKGCVTVDLGGKDDGNGLLMHAHADTLGAMVATIKPNGRLKLSPLGGPKADNLETENVRVYTRDGKIIEGTCQLLDPSIHVNKEYDKTPRTWDTIEVVLDEDVTCPAETRALGIEVGDVVCFEPRTRRTASGYLKSRFLDDKLSLGILIAFAKYIADNKIVPERKIWLHLTIYEEVGHGASGFLPAGITECLDVDMGCVGLGLNCTEKQVSICAKDSGGPYNYDMVTRLVNAAKRTGADYAVDIYPHYTSDVGATLKAGADIRHGLIGTGVYASHGYERSHIDGVYSTLKVICGFTNVI